MKLLGRIVWTAFVAGLAFFPGCFGGAFLASRLDPPSAPGKTVPLPHHVPKSPDAVAFRFAMAHDVIHERYPKHSPAFYRERERLARAKLATLPEDSDEAFDLIDDIGAGLDRLGKPAEAVPLLRRKLVLQEKRGLSGLQLYTTYANLGTFIVHANMKAAMGGNAAAKASVKEGLGLVEKSIAVNPNAHFGRETWQLAIGQFLLTAIDEPELLTTFDCIGDRLDREFSAEMFGAARYHDSDQKARPYNTGYLSMGAEYLSHMRYVATTGAETGWPADRVPSHQKPVYFDEPMLGIIGMWRQGGGPSPHFALCVGEVMLRVGQRRIAWTAF
ncbi:MAG: hypothetical protein ABGY75_13675 [Gemmataceae bacterium]